MILGGCTEEGTASRTDIHTEETKAKCLLQRPVFPFQVTGGVGLKNGGREKALGKGWERRLGRLLDETLRSSDAIVWTVRSH